MSSMSDTTRVGFSSFQFSAHSHHRSSMSEQRLGVSSMSGTTRWVLFNLYHSITLSTTVICAGSSCGTLAMSCTLIDSPPESDYIIPFFNPLSIPLVGHWKKAVVFSVLFTLIIHCKHAPIQHNLNISVCSIMPSTCLRVHDTLDVM